MIVEEKDKERKGEESDVFKKKGYILFMYINNNTTQQKINMKRMNESKEKAFLDGLMLLLAI